MSLFGYGEVSDLLRLAPHLSAGRVYGVRVYWGLGLLDLLITQLGPRALIEAANWNWVF